jgi:hypothetical protein
MINRRVNARKDLHPLFQPFYDALCEKLTGEPKPGYTWEPECGKRSFMAQDRDYAKGREMVNNIWVVKDPRKIVTKAKGGESPHNWGCATDWCLYDLDGVAHWPENKDPLWKEFIDAVTSVGLRPGSEWGDLDHCELRINVSWKTIHEVFINYGPEAKDAAIQAAMGPPVKIPPTVVA